jgi:hypothetical protein
VAQIPFHGIAQKSVTVSKHLIVVLILINGE